MRAVLCTDKLSTVVHWNLFVIRIRQIYRSYLGLCSEYFMWQATCYSINNFTKKYLQYVVHCVLKSSVKSLCLHRLRTVH